MTKEEWEKLTPYMKRVLSKEGAFPSFTEKAPEKGQPYTNVGVMNSPEYTMGMTSNVGGFTIDPEKPDLPTSDRSTIRVYNREEQEKNPKQAFVTRAHETEHALAGQGLGNHAELNPLWDKMTENTRNSSRGAIVDRLVKNSDYLVNNWGLRPEDADRGYFSKRVLKRRDGHNFLYEQLSTISALEQQTGKRFVEDPYVRKNILKTPAEREAYEALTGLRQTRLDAKDLPPYTRQPGSTSIPSDPDNAGVLDKVKSMLGFEQGGAVQMPDEYSKGSWKLI
jgi:hypothetical protein